MDQATNFALDFQQSPPSSQQEMQELVDKYKAVREKPYTLKFPDGSFCTYVCEGKQNHDRSKCGWLLNKR